ncbi:cyclic nucleotide-binding protein, partial [Myxococcota bacterium]|nr:cyclic nucleotide-binding protein [Myxococcota bacterium]
MDLTHLKRNLKGDFFGGLAATLVALPSAIAFGLIIFAPLGVEYSARGAIGGILGCIAIGFLAPLLGGTARLVSAPCAPAAAVLSVFVMEMVRRDNSPSALALVPAYLSVVILISAGLQVLAGTLKGGRIIKYIPYPVVAGYLSGVGLLIFTAQLPKLAGMPKGTTFFAALSSPASWQAGHLIVGGVTMAAMILAPRLIKSIPGAIVALFAGVLAYFAFALTDSSLLTTVGNPAVIGPILPKNVSFADMLSAHFSSFGGMRLSDLSMLLVPAGTLAVLLSVDTLKTCVVLDALTRGRHDSNRELIGQGVGNCASGLVMGIPGAGTMGASLVNVTSGGTTRLSGFFVGVFSLLTLLFFAGLIAWIPISALAGILMVVGVRMVDTKSLKMLRSWTTAFDFFVILAVIVSALTLSLLAASGVGIALAIVLFLRDQIRGSVVRRRATGAQISSKMKRLK